ncbi:MAG: hypothetical protein JXA20_18970 [Spirochaetes bacterium]|nr:hypothetical protein [Spirochaetota bacterium]
MSVKRILPILLLFFGPVCCKDDFIAEREPNNTMGQAQQAEYDREIRGYLQTGNDSDFYMVETVTDQILNVRVTGVKGINLAIKLWSGGSEPRLLKIIDDTRKSSDEVFPNLSMTPGRYYIEVCHGEKDKRVSSTTDHYSLFCTIRARGEEELEPNDTPEQSTMMIAGTEVSGYYSPSYNRLNEDRDHLHREEDWYSIEVELEPNATILMDCRLSGVQGINSELHLYGPDLAEIVASDSGGKGAGEEIRGVGITRPGRYYLMTTCKNYESNPDMPYTLTVAFRDYDSSRELEPNNEFSSATLLMKDRIAGEINPAGDIDFYSYKSPEEFGIYRIRLESLDDVDYTVGVYGPGRQKLLDINNFGVGGGELYPDIAINGDFSLSVSSRGGMSTRGGYELSVAQLDNISTMELEPNDIKTDATRVNTNSLTGYISQRSDKDYYLLEYSDRVEAVFDIKGVRGADLKVSVTDPLGYIIKSVQVKGAGGTRMKEIVDKKGYIIVESLTENFEEPYRITLRGGK